MRSGEEITSTPFASAADLDIVVSCHRNPDAAGHEMKRNLVEICDTLRKKGKQVCLATVASPDPTAAETDSASSTLNTALEHFCTRYEEFALPHSARIDASD